MDCDLFERRLEALLVGTLSEADRRACSDHLAVCDRCRDLQRLAELPAAAAATVDEQRSLRAAVMASTSGPSCEAAAARLVLAFDEPLDRADRALLELHLGGCDSCRRLADVLALLAVELPRLAEVPADPRLLERVLAATLPFGVRWRRFWAKTWPAWVQRPRFAWEAAFVAMTIFLLVVQATGSPLQALSARARAVPTAAGHVLAVPAAAVREHGQARVAAAELRSLAGVTWQAARRFAAAKLRSGRDEVGTIWRRAASSWQERTTSPSPRPAPPAAREPKR